MLELDVCYNVSFDPVRLNNTPMQQEKDASTELQLLWRCYELCRDSDALLLPRVEYYCV